MAKKILIGIALDGDSEVKKKLQEIGEIGRKSLEGKGLGSGLSGEINGFIGRLQESLKSLPGGGLLSGIIGKLTSPSGIAASIATAAGTALVAREKSIEDIQRRSSRLSALGDDKGFERLQDRAKKTGGDVAQLQGRYEKFLAFSQKASAQNPSIIQIALGDQVLTDEERQQQRERERAASQVNVINGGGAGLPPSKETFDKFDSALFSQIRRDVGTSEEANQISGEFQQGLLSGGLTPDLLRSLPPNAGKFVTDQIGKSVFRTFKNSEELIKALPTLPDVSVDKATGIPSLSASKAINAIAKPNAAFEKAARDNVGFTQGVEELTNALSNSVATPPTATGVGLGRTASELARRIGTSELPAPLNVGAAAAGQFLGFTKDNLPLRPESGRPASFDQRFDAVSGDITPALTGATSSLGTFQEALDQTAARLRAAATIPVNGVVQSPVGRASGGFVSGAGSTTSDSIPAMLSNREYVLNARATSKLGLRYLDHLNAGGMPGFADGGDVDMAGLQGQYDVTATDDGGAIVNGVYYPANAPLLQTPIIQQLLQRSRQQKSQDSRRKHKSDFTGIFGGHVFDTPGSYAKGGMVGRGIPHFATGGLMDVPDMIGSAPQLSDLGSGSPWGDMTDLGITDLRTNHGPSRVVGPVNTLRDMQRAARDAADAQTGRRPSWMHGRG